MTHELTPKFGGKVLPHSVCFYGVYPEEAETLIELAKANFGDTTHKIEQLSCQCRMSLLFPEIMKMDKNSKTIVCPFCYYHREYNNDWGYAVSNNTEENKKAYAYQFEVYFKDSGDAGFFCLLCPDSLVKHMEVNIKAE